MSWVLAHLLVWSAPWLGSQFFSHCLSWVCDCCHFVTAAIALAWFVTAAIALAGFVTAAIALAGFVIAAMGL